jgi:hypothetical protein
MPKTLQCCNQRNISCVLRSNLIHRIVAAGRIRAQHRLHKEMLHNGTTHKPTCTPMHTQA